MFRTRKTPAGLPIEYRWNGHYGESGSPEWRANLDGAFRRGQRGRCSVQEPESRGHVTQNLARAWRPWVSDPTQLAELPPLESGSVRTVTTMQVNHPTLISAVVLQYQHSTGDTVVSSLTKGFDPWVQVDLVTLLDAAHQASVLHHHGDDIPRHETGNQNGFAAPCWGRPRTWLSPRPTPRRASPAFQHLAGGGFECGTTNRGTQLPGQPRNKLKVFCSRGCDDRITGCYRTVGASENRGIERRFQRLRQHEEPIWTR